MSDSDHVLLSNNDTRPERLMQPCYISELSHHCFWPAAQNQTLALGDEKLKHCEFINYNPSANAVQCPSII